MTFLATLFTKLFWGALWNKAKTNAVRDWQAIPPKARLYIVITVAVILLALLHQWYAHHEIKKAHDAGYQSGYAQAVADIKAAEAKKVAPLQKAKQQTEARIDAKDEGVRKDAQAQNLHVDSNVTALLGMYDPQTSGGDRAHSGSGVPQANVASGAQPTGPRAHDGLADPLQAGPEPTITLPAKQLIERAATCDRDYIALKSWEKDYANYMVEYNDWLATTRKVTK